ncbi:MAG TPA: glycosyltransferase family 87 protein [Streptosporangiaceae bacterium]
MTTLKDDPGRNQDGAGDSEPAAASPPPKSQPRAVAGLTGLIRRHRLFSLALVLGAIIRLLTMLAYRPAMLFRLDSFDYLWGAVHLSPNAVNPSGYSLFLWLFLPFHSLVLVVAIQHVLGLVVAAMVYAVLRRYGLPEWGATLAALPVLFDPSQLVIEHLIMADLLAMVLMVGAFAVLLTRTAPSLWRSATAGLMMGVATIVRPTVLPLVLLIPVYLLITRVGWRRAGAALVAGLMPVLGYMSWFAAVHGTFNLTNSNGLFLWSRTMSFANCKVINPPTDLQPLCPNAQPGALHRANPALRRQPRRYLWNHRIWAWQGTTIGFVPDSAAFTAANNARALRFAVKAIEAQPGAYATTIWSETLTPFLHTDNSLRFLDYTPSSANLSPPDLKYAIGTIQAYTGNTQGVSSYLGYHFGTRLVQPYVTIVNFYQHGFYLPGPLFGVIVLGGLAGILIPGRRSSAAVLLWMSAVIIMVLPTAEHEYTYRYVLPAVPLACIALALAFRKPIGRRQASSDQDASDQDASGQDASGQDSGGTDPGRQDKAGEAAAGEATAGEAAGEAAPLAPGQATPAGPVTAAQVTEADPQTT